MEADIVIRNGTVIAIDPERRIIPDGAVAIKGDRIVAVGPSDEVARDHQAGEIIDARGMAIMPGFDRQPCPCRPRTDQDARRRAQRSLVPRLPGCLYSRLDPGVLACRSAACRAGAVAFRGHDRRFAARRRRFHHAHRRPRLWRCAYARACSISARARSLPSAPRARRIRSPMHVGTAAPARTTRCRSNSRSQHRCSWSTAGTARTEIGCTSRC